MRLGIDNASKNEVHTMCRSSNKSKVIKYRMLKWPRHIAELENSGVLKERGVLKIPGTKKTK